MSTTVAVFDNQADAEEVIDRLDALGIDEGDLHVVSRARVDDGSLMATFARALVDTPDAVASELVRLGVDRDAAAFYAEELDEEGVIVVVDADDGHDDEVLRILREGDGTLRQ